MHNLRVFALLLLICTVLPGCWNRIELNELSITSATAFDRDGEEWVITYQVITPSAISAGMGTASGGTAQSPVSVFSTRGRTIREAVNHASMEHSRRLFFSHNNVLLISEQVARYGLNQILDLHYRNPDARETVSVLITSGSARSVLEQIMHTEKIPGMGIRTIMINESEITSMLPNVMLYELSMTMTGPAKSAVIPEIIVSGEPKETSMDALKKTYSTSKFRLDRLAVVREDKLAGWLTKEEGFGVSFITNKVKISGLAFSCNQPDGQGYNSTFRIQSSTTKLKPKKQNGRFVMDVEITGDGVLMESGCALDLTNPDVVKQLEKQVAEEITRIVNKSWQATKQLRVDVLGFADAIHRKYPKDWKTLKDDWASEFVKIEMKPHVTVSMDRIGLSNKTFQTPEKR
ncbi:Ger(x)C family spore germination protein [Paenibacillus sp. HJGM_3]|uniref:Ger(x)C family spore germination protein n=1 Tax=Paenibacillus sp. HJGM_3 TaxID=3379816 RepID=UPI00385D0E0D